MRIWPIFSSSVISFSISSGDDSKKSEKIGFLELNAGLQGKIEIKIVSRIKPIVGKYFISMIAYLLDISLFRSLLNKFD